MILDDLGTLLQTAGLGTLGQTIFLGSMPLDAPGTTTPDAIMALLETPGPGPLLVHDDVLPSIEQPIVQVRVRDAPYAYQAARLRAQQAWQVLSAVHNEALSGTEYLSILPLQSPFPLDTDDFARPHLIFHVRCAKALTALP